MNSSQLMEKIDEIKSKGFTRLRSEIPIDEISSIRNKVNEIFLDQEAYSTKKDVPFLNRGHQVIYNVQNLSFELLNLLIGNKHVEEILKQCLNDTWYRQIPANEPNYILRGYSARSGGPTELPLHIDSFIPSSGKDIYVMQVAIILEAQTRNNGCTLVVPGSHTSDRYASPDDMKNAVPLESSPGDIVIWDSRLWHGALPNNSVETRWSLIGTFSRWWIKQNYQITKTLHQNIYEKLNDSQKVVMGYASIPPIDEEDRLDIKGGYEILKPQVSDYFS